MTYIASLKVNTVTVFNCVCVIIMQLKEHPERGVYVRDLSMHTVHSVGECERVIEQGWRNRAVGYTLMNKDSSRSHSIFTIHLEICSTGEKRVRGAVRHFSNLTFLQSLVNDNLYVKVNGVVPHMYFFSKCQ